MIYPSFSLEYSLLQKFKLVAGIDEVGRGCIAGPVVAAIAVISENSQYLSKVRDSKLTSIAQREQLSVELASRLYDYGIGEAAVHEIDEIGISKAACLAMQRAYENLKSRPDVTLVDGRYIKSPALTCYKINKGDAKHFVISAASILAKVHRDKLMRGFAAKYPGYGFERHVGYGTAEHKEALCRLGICEIHRKSFSPVKEMLSGK